MTSNSLLLRAFLPASLIIAASGGLPGVGVQTAAAQVPGLGPVSIRNFGTETTPNANVIGDCDDMQPIDDDFEVMSFSAPWEVIGSDQAGTGVAMGGGIIRAFIFEKDPNAANVRFVLEFGRERDDMTASDLTEGLEKVADLSFSPEDVGLYRVREPGDLIPGYAAVFPLVAVEGLPQEPGLTGRYLARVQLISLSTPEFDGWSESEIVQLFDSLYAERCLGEGMEQAFAPFAPKVSFE